MKRNVPHGSMVDAAGARPDALVRAHQQLLKASLPDPEHPARAPIPLVPLTRMAMLQSMAKTVTARQAALALDASIVLPTLAFDAAAAGEGMAIANAVIQQWLALQAQWLEGWTELAGEMGELRQANTVTKYLDQESNLVQQGLALVAAQATSTVRVLENIQVGFAWWLNRRATANVA